MAKLQAMQQSRIGTQSSQLCSSHKVVSVRGQRLRLHAAAAEENPLATGLATTTSSTQQVSTTGCVCVEFFHV
jgi:hypothetical protein